MKQYTTLQQVRCYSHLISSHFASSQPFVNSSHLIPPHLFSCLLSFSQIFSVLLTSSQLISTLLSHLIKCSHLFASTSVLLILSHFIISSDSFTSAHLNPCHLFLSFCASAHLVIYSSLCYSSTHSMFRLHHLFCSLCSSQWVVSVVNFNILSPLAIIVFLSSEHFCRLLTYGYATVLCQNHLQRPCEFSKKI